MKNSTVVINQVSEFSRLNVTFNGIGVFGTVDAGTDGFVDLKLEDDHFLTGGQLNVKGGIFGDRCDMQVVDADGSMRTAQVPGQPTGVTFSMLPTYPVLSQFYTACQIMDASQKQQTFSTTYPAKILAGMTLRIHYHSTGPNDVMIGINFDLHKAIY